MEGGNVLAAPHNCEFLFQCLCVGELQNATILPKDRLPFDPFLSSSMAGRNDGELVSTHSINSAAFVWALLQYSLQRNLLTLMKESTAEASLDTNWSSSSRCFCKQVYSPSNHMLPVRIWIDKKQLYRKQSKKSLTVPFKHQCKDPARLQGMNDAAIIRRPNREDPSDTRTGHPLSRTSLSATASMV